MKKYSISIELTYHQIVILFNLLNKLKKECSEAYFDLFENPEFDEVRDTLPPTPHLKQRLIDENEVLDCILSNLTSFFENQEQI